MNIIKEFKFFVNVLPVPASRARVSQYGTFYLKNYETFRTDCKKALVKYKTKHLPTQNKFKVHLEFVCKKPKVPSYDYPYRGDLDNFEKGILDCITQSNIFWMDDAQICHLSSTKRYQEEDEDYGIFVTVIEYK